MYEYAIAGRIVELTALGETTDAEIAAVLLELRGDPQFPTQALVLLDLRAREGPLSSSEIAQRLTRFFDLFERRLGAYAAIVVGNTMYDAIARGTQAFATARGLRVCLFTDPAEARAWLGRQSL